MPNRFWLALPANPRIPWPWKLAYTLFVCLLVPYYWNFYGPANFLWLCDIAIFFTVVALWWESPFLASMQLVSAFLPSLVWIADFFSRLASGHFLTRWTHYMFNPEIPLVIRTISLFHIWLPFFLFWLVVRLGYHRKGWIAQSLLSSIILPVSYFFTDPARGLNGVFGPGGGEPQTWMAPELWLLGVMVIYPVGVYLPSHVLFTYLFRQRPAPGPSVLVPP